MPADRLPRANALLGAAFNLQVMAGPVIGGLLVGLAGPSAAFGATAGSFLISALLLTRLGLLPPVAAGAGGDLAAGPGAPGRAGFAGLMAQTRAGLSYVARSAVPRALVLATVLFVSFASMDNVALVFLVARSLRGSPGEYGIAVAAYGAGMLGASLGLAVLAERRTPRFWLAAGFATGAAGTIGTGLAGSIAMAAAAQAVAGAGNTADLVGNDTLLQQVVPPAMLGRVFGALATAAQAGAGIAYAAAAPVVALTSPRITFLIAGAWHADRAGSAGARAARGQSALRPRWHAGPDRSRQPSGRPGSGGPPVSRWAPV